MDCVSQVRHAVWTAFEAKAPKCCSLGLLAWRDKVVALMQRIWSFFSNPTLSKLKKLFPGLEDEHYQKVLKDIQQQAPKGVAVELKKVNKSVLKISWGTQIPGVWHSKTFEKEEFGFCRRSTSAIYSKASLITGQSQEIKRVIEEFAEAYPMGQFEIIIPDRSRCYFVRCYKNGSEGDALELYVPNNGEDSADYMLLPVGGAYALKKGIEERLQRGFPQATRNEIDHIIAQLDRVIKADYLNKDDPTLMTSFSFKYIKETKIVEFRAVRTTEPKWEHVIEFDRSPWVGLKELGFSFTVAPFKEDSHWEVLRTILQGHQYDSRNIIEDMKQILLVPAQFRISVKNHIWKVEALDAEGNAKTVEV